MERTTRTIAVFGRDRGRHAHAPGAKPSVSESVRQGIDWASVEAAGD